MREKIKKTLDDETFLRTAYNIVLNREPDSNGNEFFLNSLKNGNLSRVEIISEFARSQEFLNLYVTRGKLDIWNQVHKVRLELIQKHLPESKVILDLGGSTPSDPRGALLHFGYPYTPEKICIVDLPTNKRMMDVTKGEKNFKEKNLEVKYFYRNMSDLSCFKDNTFGLVR